MMKSKYLAAGFVLLVLVGVVSPLILDELGTFLIVDERVGEVDVVVANGFFGKALRCYKEGRCKKLVLAFQKEASRDWLVLRGAQSEIAIRNRARKTGIEDEDLYLLYIKPDNDLQNAQTFRNFFKHKKIRSVLFLSSYYKTRRHRFYFDRSLSGSETVVYIQPDEEPPRFDGWWKKTTYANYFLSEYLLISWYVFNKLFWTSAV